MSKARTLTVQQLHKQLGQLVEAGHGRKPVCVDKASFHHPCEGDGVTILHVHSVELEPVLAWQDDGTTDANGNEHYRQTAVLRGDAPAFHSVISPQAMKDYLCFAYPVPADRWQAAEILGRYSDHLRRLLQPGA